MEKKKLSDGECPVRGRERVLSSVVQGRALPWCSVVSRKILEIKEKNPSFLFAAVPISALASSFPPTSPLAYLPQRN